MKAAAPSSIAWPVIRLKAEFVSTTAPPPSTITMPTGA
jgi:hypothetical protein